MFIKEMELKLCVLNTQRGQRTGTGQATASKRQVMSLQGDGVNVRKSSFSALLRQQQLRIPGLGMMGVWVGKGGGGCTEPHTCQMICHYRGVSTQLSPPNHPSNPSSHHPPHLHLHPLNSTLQSSQNTPCIPQAAPVSLTALLLNLPLLPYTLPWEKMYPCERDTQHTERIVWMCDACSCPPCTRQHDSHVLEYMFIQRQSCLYRYRKRTVGAEFLNQRRMCELVQAVV